ncbi:MAG: CDP-diacylglycerol--glycerol-3-phosphate 3-phosphatidyltransferase [Planctomycetota bacterium]|nr:CDP-diacylglycerol--glycerol-3-phosphate 3-phosphatidyltransferase [Planctomycetota bacterium]
MAIEPTTQTAKPQLPAIEPIDRRSLNVPNMITASRLVLSVVLFELIYLDGYWLTSAGLFVFAAATDFLDGYVARRYGQVTTLGRILDPFVDKIIVGGAFIFLINKETDIGDGDMLSSGINAWMALIVIGREMFVSSLRGFLEQQGRDFSADWLGKAKMVTQCVAVTASLLSMSSRVASESFIQLRDVLVWTAVLITAYSGFAYIVRAIRMLKAPARS